MIPAVALEQAVMERIISLGTRDTDRERVVKEALGDFGAEARKLGSEAEVIRHRLTAVQTEINNLVGVLKRMGQDVIASVRDELARLDEERSQLRERLQAHTEQAAPQAAEAAYAAKRFIETWSTVGELLEQATPEERRTILQHYVEVVEIRFNDSNGKMGSYALRLFPEVRPLDAPPSRNGNGAPVSGADGDPVLTEEANLCQFDSKAPRQGLEPWT
jgi:site-specific DNA recombinase